MTQTTTSSIDGSHLESTRAMRLRISIAGVLFILGAAASWWRLSPMTRGTVWAEDGTRFYAEIERYGFWGSLGRSYAGYLQVGPRLLTWFATRFSTEHYAVAMTLGCCLAVGVVTAVVFLCSASVTRSLPAQIVVAAATFAVPAAGVEVLGNAANIHSYLLWMTPWVLLARPRRAATVIALSVLVLLASLSEIQTVYFVPLILFRWRHRRSWCVFGALAVGLVAQLRATLIAPRPSSPYGRPSLVDIEWGYVVNVVGSLGFGRPHHVAHLVTSGYGVLLQLLLVVPVAAFLVLLRWGERQEWIWGIVALVGTVVTWTGSVVLNPTPLLEYTSYSARAWSDFDFVRYCVTSSMLLLSLIALAAGVLLRRIAWTARVVGVGLVAAMAAAVVIGWHVPSQRELGPAWAAQIRRDAAPCAAGRQSVMVKLAPMRWATSVACRQISAK